MPPEQDDLNRQLEAPQQQEDLNRQLEALQRYVSDLQQQREHAKAAAAQPPAPEPEPRRPSRRWLLLTGLLVTLALVGGIFVGAVAWSTDQPAGAKAGVAGASATPSPDTTASPRSPRRRARRRSTGPTRCSPAPSSCGGAGRVQQDHERPVHSQPLRPRGGREDRSVAAGRASESARFDQALADYRQIVDQCELRTP